MRRLELDFVRTRPAAPWAGWMLLAAAVALAADLGRSYYDVRAAIALNEARLARADPAARAAPPPREATAGELAAARDTIHRLATPWGRLFAALESAPTEGVALLGVTPDPQSASVLITGEARDYEVLVRYVAALRGTAPLARAYLARHETRAGAVRYRLAFSIRAPWSFAR